MADVNKHRRVSGAQVEPKSLTKHFGRVVAVDNVDLHIKSGEFLTLQGPSGSGTTPTLMMIAGFVLPTSGDILVNVDSVILKPPYKRDIGMVFQNYALLPHMTVADTIAFPLQMRRISTWPKSLSPLPAGPDSICPFEEGLVPDTQPTLLRTTSS
jgi:putative spermidine/putrescine transport system ATP-binding protein